MLWTPPIKSFEKFFNHFGMSVGGKNAEKLNSISSLNHCKINVVVNIIKQITETAESKYADSV